MLLENGEDMNTLKTFKLEVPCPRCGRKHRLTVAKKFKKPVKVGNVYTHWSVCPVTKEPVIYSNTYSRT